MAKNLGIGVERFSDLIQNNCYYIDKTQYIKTIMESGSDVLLIARPRRFGKTLFLDTVRIFLEIDKDNPGDVGKHKELFAGLNIGKEENFCKKFMGQHPVLSISLKNVKGESFEDAMSGLANTRQPIVEKFVTLLSSPHLTADDKVYLENCQYRKYLQDPQNKVDLGMFIDKMARILCSVNKKPTTF